MKPLQIEGIRALADNGSVNFVGIATHRSATGIPTYTVEINQRYYVANRKNKSRHFAKAETCLQWLRDVGITHVDGILL